MLRVKSLLNTCPARIGLCLLYTSMCIRDSTELESDDVDTIAGYYLTGVGAIPTQEVKEPVSYTHLDVYKRQHIRSYSCTRQLLLELVLRG